MIFKQELAQLFNVYRTKEKDEEKAVLVIRMFDTDTVSVHSLNLQPAILLRSAFPLNFPWRFKQQVSTFILAIVLLKLQAEASDYVPYTKVHYEHHIIVIVA